MSQPCVQPDLSSAASVRPRPGRALLATAVVLNAAVLVVGSTVAAFTGKQTVPQTSTSGAVTITLDSAGTAAVQAGVTGLGAGDWFERTLTVSAGAGLPIGSWTLSTTATTSSALDTTATHGLRLSVDRCTVPWTDTGSGSVHRYTCSGTSSNALAERDITMSAQALAGLVPDTNHLRLKVTLADSAPDGLQSLTSTIAYTFAGVQRAGQAR